MIGEPLTEIVIAILKNQLHQKIASVSYMSWLLSYTFLLCCPEDGNQD